MAFLDSTADANSSPLGQGGAGLPDIATQLKLANQNMSLLIQTISSIFPRVFGSFTLSAAATTAVSQADIAANSLVLLMPTNAAAATLMGSAKSLYVSVRTAGTGFTVATANGVAAAGTEAFSYGLWNPT